MKQRKDKQPRETLPICYQYITEMDRNSSKKKANIHNAFYGDPDFQASRFYKHIIKL